MYHGYDTDNKQLVTIKMLKNNLINLQLIARLHDDYELNRQLTQPSIIQVYNLQSHYPIWILIMEDIQSDLLKNIITTESLYSATQYLLYLSAVIENQFNLEQQTSEFPILTPQSAFYHDSIRQAHNTASQNKLVLLYLGQIWLTNTTNKKRIDNIFTMVEYLNSGYSLRVKLQEILELVRLNLAMGKTVQAILTYITVQSYLTASKARIIADIWREYNSFAADLYKTGAETEYFNGNIESTKILTQVMLTQTKTVVEQIEIYNFLNTQYFYQNQTEFTISVDSQTLQQLQKTELPHHDLQLALNHKLFFIEPYWRDKAMITSLDKTVMIHSKKRATTITLLSYLATVAMSFQQRLFNFIHVKVMIHLSLEYGHVTQSALSYAYYGLLLIQIPKNYQRAMNLHTLL